jgi:hypothetical protein
MPLPGFSQRSCYGDWPAVLAAWAAKRRFGHGAGGRNAATAAVSGGRAFAEWAAAQFGLAFPGGNARAGSCARLASRAEDEFQLRVISYRPKCFR